MPTTAVTLSIPGYMPDRDVASEPTRTPLLSLRSIVHLGRTAAAELAWAVDRFHA